MRRVATAIYVAFVALACTRAAAEPPGSREQLPALVVFVCGPFLRGALEAEFLSRFVNSRLVGLNLSMDLPLEEWDPFDFLIERDSSRAVNADMVFLSRKSSLHVIGLCLVEPHPEADVEAANGFVDRLVSACELSVVRIDTRLDVNGSGLRTPAEIETLIARMDAIVTTRLHGLVLALKNGVPVIAIDAVPGGGKIRRQASAIGWPLVFTLEDVTDEKLIESLDYCVSTEARDQAVECHERALRMAEEVHHRFISALRDPESIENRFRTRNTPTGIKEFLASAGIVPTSSDVSDTSQGLTREPSRRKAWTSVLGRAWSGSKHRRK